jgi:hypothetical protein
MSFISALTKLVKRILNVETAKMRTNTVCQVVSYDGNTNLASLQPCIMAIRTDDTESPTKQLPPVNDIPVFQFGSGKLLCTVAPAAGTYGLYVVSDRKVENWITQGGVVPPGSKMRFDISNGFFLPGLFPTVTDGDNGVISPAVNTDRIELRTRDGAGFVSMVDDGTVEINGNADFAVAYTDLKSAFDQLKSDFDTFVTTKYNLHNHPTAPAGPVSIPSVVGAASTADMSGAKLSTIKVP